MKRVYILTLASVFLFSSSISFAQDKKKPALLYPKGNDESVKPKAPKVKTEKAPTENTEATSVKTEKATVGKVKAGFGVSVVQVKAQFPGGQDGLVAFVQKNMKYPVKSRLAGQEGRVYIGFMISKEGKVKDAKLMASVNEELDAEAMRIVQMMPDWTPASTAGQAVEEWYVLPFDYALPKKS